MSKHDSITIDRRTAIKWVMAASAALGAPSATTDVFAAEARAGYGKDPDLLKAYKPGELWPLVLTAAQKDIARVLSDTILPRDGDSPSASESGAVEFINEWISAPYDNFAKDRTLIVSGMSWIDKEAQRRFNKRFADLSSSEIKVICDEISPREGGKAVDGEPGAFFARFRTLTAVAYYTTPAGMKDLGYVGNVPLAAYPGPPPEVLKKVGLI